MEQMETLPGEESMNEIVNDADDRIVVGYFADGADAYRAINELIDEGFRPSEIGAAFRTPRAGAAAVESSGPRVVEDTNPAVSGSVGGAGSDDQAVQPAGLAPGSGNAFPAPSRPGPITGSELPRTLPHDLPSALPTEAELHRTPVIAADSEPARRARMRQVFDDASNAKFGTGEGHLFLDYDYSEPSFENSFVGMGLGSREARALSGELRRGGAVVSVAPGTRASLAEGILERNHGRIRFESFSPAVSEIADGDARVEVYGRMHNYYRSEEGYPRAS